MYMYILCNCVYILYLLKSYTYTLDPLLNSQKQMCLQCVCKQHLKQIRENSVSVEDITSYVQAKGYQFEYSL